MAATDADRKQVLEAKIKERDGPAAVKPAAVKPPPTPGKLSKEQVKASAARLATQGKRERPKSAPLPGPGSHDPDKRTYRQPSWTFGGPKKPTGAGQQAWMPTSKPAKSDVPGPVPEEGRDPKRPGALKSPNWKFGTSPRRWVNEDKKMNAEVGPGTYEPKKRTYRSPQWVITKGNPPTKAELAEAEAKAKREAKERAKKEADDLAMHGDLFSEPFLVHGIKSAPKVDPNAKNAKSAADLPDPSGGEGSGAAGEGDSTAIVQAAPTTGADGFADNLAGAKNVDWKALTKKLPTGKDEQSKARRKQLWKRADPNGNGFLSSAEVDLMVRDTVGAEMFSAKPVIQSAFHAARRSGGGSQSGRSGDYIERGEFRTLLIMLRQYYELYAMFNRLDTSDDRRIDLSEFKQGAEMVASWGVELPSDQMDAEFASIDTDGGGKILFDEFAQWGILKALDLEDDDNYDDGGETAKHEAVGYIEQRDAGKTSKIVTREPQPTMCYTPAGAVVMRQTMPRAEPARSPFSPHSPSRAKVSPVFQLPSNGRLQVLGGLPFRKITGGTKFLPHHAVPKNGTPAGLPFALGQLLLEKSKEDYEAQTAVPKSWTAEERAYGALDLSKKPDDAKKALKDGSGHKKALENKSASTGKGTAKVAPA